MLPCLLSELALQRTQSPGYKKLILNFQDGHNVLWGFWRGTHYYLWQFCLTRLSSLQTSLKTNQHTSTSPGREPDSLTQCSGMARISLTPTHYTVSYTKGYKYAFPSFQDLLKEAWILTVHHSFNLRKILNYSHIFLSWAFSTFKNVHTKWIIICLLNVKPHRPSVGTLFDKVYRYFCSESTGVPSKWVMLHNTLAFGYDKKLSATDQMVKTLSQKGPSCYQFFSTGQTCKHRPEPWPLSQTQNITQLVQLEFHVPRGVTGARETHSRLPAHELQVLYHVHVRRRTISKSQV